MMKMLKMAAQVMFEIAFDANAFDQARKQAALQIQDLTVLAV